MALCVFKKGDPKDLARKIDFWIEHSELKKELQKKYISNSAVFSQEDCMAAMRSMLSDVAGGNV